MNNPLGFTNKWFEIGVLTLAKLDQLEREYHAGDDKNPEHYRWRAFTVFVESSRPIDSTTAKALYELGKNDPDSSLGGSMMREILRLEECPDELIQASLTSNRSHLSKAAEKRQTRSSNDDRD